MLNTWVLLHTRTMYSKPCHASCVSRMTIGLYIFLIDPHGQPIVTACSDHCFHTYIPLVRPPLFKTKHNSSEYNVHHWRDCGVGLAEWIIDDTFLVLVSLGLINSF